MVVDLIEFLFEFLGYCVVCRLDCWLLVCLGVCVILRFVYECLGLDYVVYLC